MHGTIVEGVQPHRTWAEIDLDAFGHNLAVARARAGAGVRLLLVLKADAYGLGAAGLWRYAIRAGVGAIGVGTGAEAMALRAEGAEGDLVVLGSLIADELDGCLRSDVQVGVQDSHQLGQLQAAAARLGVSARVHINVDTGMGRLGTSLTRAPELLRQALGAPHIEVAGLMTHMADPAGWSPTTRAQLLRFQGIVDEARRMGGFRGWTHAYNSATLFTAPDLVGDTVRVGIAAFGAMPAGLSTDPPLRPVLSWHTQVGLVKTLEPGATVGYGSEWRAPARTRLATLPLGYADGLRGTLGGRGEVLVRGQRAPIVGRVSMDYTTIDVTGVPGVSVGDQVTLIGEQGSERITLEGFARRASTIGYEITCGLGQRVHREYVGGELEVPTQVAPSTAVPAPRQEAVEPTSFDKVNP